MEPKAPTNNTGTTRWSDRGTKKEAIKAILAEDPGLTPKEVAAMLHTTNWYVYSVMRKEDLRSAPLHKRICRIEERMKTLEEGMLKVLTAKGLLADKSKFGL